MKGLIVLNAYSRLAPCAHQAARLKEEFARLGVDTDIKRCGQLNILIDGNGVTADTRGYDFCVFLDKDAYAANSLEKCGLRLFNNSAAIAVCDDKVATHVALAGAVPMPATIPAPLCYTPDADTDGEFLNKIESRLGYPLIVKRSYGSRGEYVFKADDRRELEALEEKLQLIPHLFQKFVSESAGKDLRAIVLGGKVIAAMQRTSQGDFRSNIDLGGSGTRTEITPEMQHICGRIAKILNIDYCGVDLLIGNEGLSVCEVNSNAFFRGIEAATGVNVAGLYAEYVYKQIYG